jgi:AAA domain
MSVHVFDFEVEDEDGQQSRIRLVPFDEIELGTERRYLIKGLIPRTGLIVVWGPPKAGKSFKVLDLVMHVALNRLYRGRRVHQGAVVYCAFEGQRGINARCVAFRKKFLPTHHEPVAFYLEPVTLDLVKDAPELIRVIRRTLGDVKPAVIVLDTLNRSLRGSESSDEDMSAYVRAADSLREEFDCAVIIVHHCGVDGTRPRGHTSLTGAADAQLSVTGDPAGDIIMTVEHMKEGATGETIVSRLEIVEVGIDEDGDRITSCVVVPAETCGKAAVQVKGAAKVALGALCEAILDHGEIVEDGPIPPNTRTISVVRWREYCDAKTIADTDDPDSKRKAFVRASKKLQELQIIGVWKDRVWVSGHAGQART